jgi:hypothetical protein
MPEKREKASSQVAFKEDDLEDGFYNRQHPYGVKPSGNAYFCTQTEAMVRPFGLGKHLRSITDEALLEMLSFLTPQELASLSACSRALYVYSHHTDLWRDLTLRKCEGIPIEYQSSWKETFMVSTQKSNNNYNNNDNNNIANVKHVPISVNGIFSNLLHRSWSCRTCDLATACPGFYKHNDIQRREAKTMNTEQFLNQYEIPNIPLIITDAVNYWPALKRWNEDFLVSTSCSEDNDKGSIEGPTFRATSATAPVAATFTLRGYFCYLHQSCEEAPLYLFDRNFAKKMKSLKNDYDVPVYFRSTDDDNVHTTNTIEEEKEKETSINNTGKIGTDLFRVFGADARPDYRWLICGPKRSGSIFHIDPNQTNAWNVSIQGRKKWIFYPPHVSPPGVLASADGQDVTVPISTGEWLLSFWSQHLEARKNPNPSQRPLEAIVNPGEVIFVPHGYWHMVVNLDDCIALTHNYVSTSNLANCLRFLRDKKDQISGVRDRVGTVNPDNMHETFLNELKKANIMKENDLQLVIEKSMKGSIHSKKGELSQILLSQKRKINQIQTIMTEENVNKKKLKQKKDDDEVVDDSFSFSFF